MDGVKSHLWFTVILYTFCVLCPCHADRLSRVTEEQKTGKPKPIDVYNSFGEKAHERKIRAVDGAQPEGVAETEGEPYVSSESTSEAETTGEVRAEGESEAGVESEAGAESEVGMESETRPVSLVGAESEFGVESEAGAESEVGAESEAGAESEVGAESEAREESYPETTAETEPEVAVEPEGVVEPEAEAEAEAEERPQPYEILLPPISLMVIIILGLIILATYSKRSFHLRWFRVFITRLGKKQVVHILEPQKKTPLFAGITNANDKTKITSSLTTVNVQETALPAKQEQPKEEAEDDQEFFTDFDLEVLGSLGSFNSRPLQLVRVATPALLSLALCPATLYLYQPLVTFFWPPYKFAAPPDINEAIACFLAPAGLVYATSFGFAFQQALTKQQNILSKMTHELGLLDQIVTMVSKINLPSLQERMAIYKAVKAEAIFVTLQVMNTTPVSFKNKPREDVTIKIWSIIDRLRNVVKECPETFDLDHILANKIVSHVLELNSICSDRMGTLHARIHPLKWAFLESLGFFSFFGILLLQAQSYRTELTMCIITVFSISLLCYVVSDLDSPFCGFFQVDLSALPEVVMRIRKAYELAKQGHNVLCTYPSKDKTGYDK